MSKTPVSTNPSALTTPEVTQAVVVKPSPPTPTVTALISGQAAKVAARILAGHEAGVAEFTVNESVVVVNKMGVSVPKATVGMETHVVVSTNMSVTYKK